MPNATVDDVLLSLGDQGLGHADLREIDALCRSRLQVAIEHERRQRPGRPLLRLASLPVLARAIVAMLAIGAGVYLVPATRAAIDDVYSSVTSWFSGGPNSVPGRPVDPADDAPSWVTNAGGQKRILAETGGAKLYVNEDGGRLTIGLGNTVGLSDTIDGWRSQFAGHKLVLLGPGDFSDHAADQRPIFGLASKSVSRVAVAYASGPPVSEDHVDGAFALTVDTTRPLRAVIAYDSGGNILERVDVSDWHLGP